MPSSTWEPNGKLAHRQAMRVCIEKSYPSTIRKAQTWSIVSTVVVNGFIPLRPYLQIYTASLSELRSQLCRACLVLRWGTTWEVLKCRSISFVLKHDTRRSGCMFLPSVLTHVTFNARSKHTWTRIINTSIVSTGLETVWLATDWFTQIKSEHTKSHIFLNTWHMLCSPRSVHAYQRMGNIGACMTDDSTTHR